MKRNIVLFLCYLSVIATQANEWTLSNSSLTVTFDDQSNQLSVLDNRCGKKWSQHPLSGGTQPLTVKKVEQKENSLQIEFNGTNGLSASLSLSGSSSLEVTLSGTDSSDFTETSFPRALFAENKEHYLVATDGEGLLVRVDDNVYPFILDTKPYCMVGGQSMAWYGMVDTDFKTGYMIILETPDDALFRVYRESGTAGFEPYWFPQMGKFGYERKAVYHFFDEGGYVAQCKKYKDFIYPKNEVRTLRENQQRVPSIEKMVGGVHIYVWDNAREVEFAQYLKGKGIDKAFFLWDPNHLPYPVDGYDNYLKELGFASGVQDLYRDIHSSDSLKYEIVKKPNTKYLARWQHPGEYPAITMKNSSGGIVGNVFGSSVCPIPAIECVKTRVEFENAIYPHESHFVDVYTSDGLYECYDSIHRATRTQYKEAIGDIYEMFMEKYHKFCGGEWGADFVGSKIVFAHGMMTLSRVGCDTPPGGNWDNDKKPSMVVGTHEKTPMYLEYSINENTRVPLFELVYHDAIVTSWRWEDGNHHAPAIWWKKDLFNMLYGTAPLWSIDKESFLPYENQFIESYNNISPWLREIGYDEMLNHSFITADHKVQRTDFASGKSIVVNFRLGDYTYEGQVVKAKSYLIIGVSPKQYLIQVTAGSNGSITPSGTQTVAHGSSLSFSITPNSGYVRDQVLIDAVNNPNAVSSGTYTFSNVTDNHYISALFKVGQGTTASINSNGTMMPEFNVNTTSYTITLPCNENSLILDVTGSKVEYLGDSNNGILNFSEAGTKQIIVRITSADNTSKDYNITVIRPFDKSMIVQYWDDILAVDQSKQKFKSFHWTQNGKPVGDPTKSYVSLSKLPETAPTDIYNVELTMNNGQKIPVCEGVRAKTIVATTSLIVYPTPVSKSKRVTVKNPDYKNVHTVELFDMNGLLVGQYPSTETTTIIDVSGLPSGLYVVQAGKQTGRIVIGN